MRPHVIQMFVGQFSTELEGRFPHMYIDRRRLVTAGVGNLCEPIHLALRFPWMMGDRRATVEEVTEDWHNINNREEQLWNTVAVKQAQYTRVRLTEEAIDAMVRHQLQINIDYMRNFLVEWDSYPSDAQFALASAAWALGAGLDKTRPALVRAVSKGDWIAAKMHAHLGSTNNPGVVPRNRHQELCFDNAYLVQHRGLDRAPLWWPNRTPDSADLKTLATQAVAMGIGRTSEAPKGDV